MRRRKRKNNLKLAFLVLTVCSVALAGFALSAKMSGALIGEKQPSAVSSAPAALAEVSAVPKQAPKTEPAPQPSKICFMAAGDNLIHDNIYKQAAARTGGAGFDFDLPYQEIAPIFEPADVCFINQETIIAEKLFELSGYPLFNSPEAVGDKLVDMGFNVVNISNNHMFDMGEQGLYAALDFWEAKPDLLTMGAWRHEQDMKEPLLFEKNGITIGFVPVTEHTNGLKLPKDTELRFIRSDEYELMREQVELAKLNSDFVVVSMHWGTENSTETNDNQLYIAQMLADWGVDLVLGHHSHTLQPMEWRTGKAGNKTLVVYSLGNFISSMLDPQNMLGGVLKLEIEKDGGETAITKAQMIPVVTQYDGTGRSNVRIYQFADYTEELLKKHGMKQWHDNFSISYMKNIIDRNIPKEFLSEDYGA